MGRPQGGLFSRHHCFNDQRFECLAEENILAHAVRVDADMQAAPLAEFTTTLDRCGVFLVLLIVVRRRRRNPLPPLKKYQKRSPVQQL